jgi:hypothetical protein
LDSSIRSADDEADLDLRVPPHLDEREDLEAGAVGVRPGRVVGFSSHARQP